MWKDSVLTRYSVVVKYLRKMGIQWGYGLGCFNSRQGLRHLSFLQKFWKDTKGPLSLLFENVPENASQGVKWPVREARH